MHFVHSCDVDTVQVQVNLSKVLYATHKNSRKNMVENSEIAGKIVMLWLSTKRNYCDSNYTTFRLPWVHSLHCPSKNFFLFFSSPSKNFFLFSMRVFDREHVVRMRS